ncbi:MAG TPA: PP2C family protein-serine/threonine phosphatase [Vicinamibacterales bacterium]|nr:PP2C family protein-serine/threonine phosphatase [Vicinamibacterales bacterium]
MADHDSSPPDPGVFRTLGNDLRVVWQQIADSGASRTFHRSIDELEEFYLSTHSRDRLAAMRRGKRTVYLSLWLLKALFLKLTPSRRLLLLLSMWLLWVGVLNVSVGRQQVTVQFPFLGIAVLLFVLMLELKDKLLARNELEAGRAVQLALMPDRPPSFPGWDIWLFTRSANDVGGDLVDYLRIDPQRLAVALGDVAGKALPAALLMAKLQATLRALASQCPSLGELGRQVNRILNRDGLPNRFATLVYLELAPDSGRVRLLNAGHMPPLLVQAGSIRETPPGGIALGIVPEADCVEQQVELQAGDLLLVYSDGVTDAMNGAGEFFGEERLRAALAAVATSTAEVAGRSLLAAADAFTGDARAFDDLSLVVLKRLA